MNIAKSAIEGVLEYFSGYWISGKKSYLEVANQSGSKENCT